MHTRTDGEPGLLNGEHTPSERWLTYAEAGALLGISMQAARQLAKRRGWPRRTPNEYNAMATVLVPPAATVRPRAVPDGVHTPNETRMISALEVAIAAVREAKDGEIATLHGVIDGLRDNVARSVTLLDLEHARSDRAEQERNAERARADAADTERRTVVARLERVEAERAAMLDRAEVAERRVEASADDRRVALARADHAEAAVAGERARADALRERLDRLRSDLVLRGAQADEAATRARTAEQAAAALRKADAERRALGRWARLRAAWRRDWGR